MMLLLWTIAASGRDHDTTQRILPYASVENRVQQPARADTSVQITEKMRGAAYNLQPSFCVLLAKMVDL